MAEAGYFKVFGNESAYRPVWALSQPSSLSAITSLKAIMLLPSLSILIPPKTWSLVLLHWDLEEILFLALPLSQCDV